MAEKPDEVASVSQCTVLVNLLKEFQDHDVDSRKLVKRNSFKDDHSRKMTNSEILWPVYNDLVEKWAVFVKELLKETVEAVFAKLAQCDGTDLNYSKKHLLAKCDEVVCVFDGATGIDKIFQMLLKDSTISLSKEVLPLQLNFCYSYSSSPGIEKTPFEINSVDNLSALLHFYYGVHCISSGKNSEYFSEMNCKPFRLPIKSKFQECFGEIPGDFLHYFYKNVKDYKQKAYIYHAGYSCAREFFNVLTHALYDAVSKFMKEHFDIDF